MKILVVDDSPEAREMLGALFAGAGHSVTTASDGKVALDLLQGGFEPDFIMTDLVMPNLDGLAFLLKAKEEKLLKCPVGVMSAYYPDAEQIKEADFTIKKPISPEKANEVLERAEALLGAKS